MKTPDWLYHVEDGGGEGVPAFDDDEGTERHDGRAAVRSGRVLIRADDDFPSVDEGFEVLDEGVRCDGSGVIRGDALCEAFVSLGEVVVRVENRRFVRKLLVDFPGEGGLSEARGAVNRDDHAVVPR